MHDIRQKFMEMISGIICENSWLKSVGYLDNVIQLSVKIRPMWLL